MTTSLQEEAIRLADAGLRVLPLRPGKKIPMLSDWPQKATTEADQIRSWWAETPSANIGIATGRGSGVIVLDIDTKEGKKGGSHLEELERKWGKLPPTIEVRTGSGGRHLYFAYPERVQIPSQKPFPDVEIKSDGSQVVAPPSSCVGSERGHDAPYAFAQNGFRGDPPALPEGWIRALARKDERDRPEPGNVDFAKVRGALFAIPANLPHDEWIRVGYALYAASPTFESVWHEWSATVPESYNQRDASTAWKSFCKGRGDIAPATLFFIARSHGWKEGTPSGNPGKPGGDNPDPEIHADDSWTNLLLRSDKGALKVNSHNLLLVLQNDPAYRGKICFNMFSAESVYRKGDLLEPFTDASVILLAAQLEGKYPWGGAINPRSLDGIIDAVSRHTPIHPIRDWLDDLTWDGIERIEHLFIDFYGADDTPYVRSVGRNLMIGAVARILKPGCKLDTMPILEGKQGLMKSTSLKVLFGSDYAMEVKESPESKDFNQSMRGKWCLEFADLDTFSRAEVNRLKNQLSTQIDTYRASYARRSCDYPRQSFFVGTTNEDTYLRDPTGARRYLPVRCRSIDLKGLAASRDQLFAEAVQKFRNGIPWHVIDDPDQAVLAQEERYLSDSWEDYILPWLERPDSPLQVSVSMVLEGALKIPGDKQDRSAQVRVGSILHRAGYRQVKGRYRPRIYEKSPDG
ncbi:MAG: VapE domain-containing protein [Thermoplasmataceae archaeon]